MADGFLSRWAKRKEAVRKGEEVVPEPINEVVAGVPLPLPPPGGEGSLASSPSPLGEGQGGSSADQPPPPTLAEAQSLTPDSDFTRFVKPEVTPEVKNAAMKKLFADPHFNVMDGLDVYIDDYSRPDPIPPEMLKQLVSAKFLKLFEEKAEEQAEKAPTGGEAVDDLGPETVAQSGTRTEQALPPADEYADPDLRLQQDDAPGPAGPGAGSR